MKLATFLAFMFFINLSVFAQKNKLFTNKFKYNYKDIKNNNHLMGRGNMYGTVTLTPAGVGDVIKTGWDIKRLRMCRDKDDGKKSTQYWDNNWVNDDSHDSDELLKPVNNQIYVIDSPNISCVGNNVSSETNNNFKEWVEWNKTRCSDEQKWYYKGTWKAGNPETITNHAVGIGHMTLPTK